MRRMTSQEAREKVEALVENSTTGVAIMEAVDAYGDARELKGHVAACGKLDGPYCGEDGVPYCDEAKRLQGGTHDEATANRREV